jgi:hypothetical protein
MNNANANPNPNPNPNPPVQRKRASVKLSLWNTVGRELNLIKKGPNGKLQIPRKNTPEYTQIKTEFERRKQRLGL